MKIGFYIHHSTIRAGGIFTYSIGILKLLLKSNEIEKILLIYSPEIRQNLTFLSGHPKIEFFEIDRTRWDIKFRLMLSYFFYDSYLIIKNYLPDTNKFGFLKSLSFSINPYRSKLNSQNISLLHIPMQYAPVYSLNLPVIITMHDLQDFHYPEYFSSQERIHRAINNKKSLEESAHVIVSFNHVKKDLLKYFRIDEAKISVCPPPFTDDWFTENSSADPEILKKRYSLPAEFILYPAATWQHKNHLGLLNSIYALKSEGKRIFLICTGNKTDYFKNVLAGKISELNIQDEVSFLGIVPESDLVGLYKSARLVVIPTLYEAGSAPLYEAMRYGTPVICSNTTSLPETIGDDEFVFNPTNIDEMTEKIRLGLYDNNFRERNLANSNNQLLRLGKIDYAKNFIETYKKILAVKPNNRD